MFYLLLFAGLALMFAGAADFAKTVNYVKKQGGDMDGTDVFMFGLTFAACGLGMGLTFISLSKLFIN